MILLILRLLIAALLTLTGVAEDTSVLSLGEVVTETCTDGATDDECGTFEEPDTAPPSELPGPSD